MADEPIGTILDGKTIDQTTTTQVVASGSAYVTLTFPCLEHISAVLEVIVTTTDPLTCVDGLVRSVPVGNTVGTTICGIAAGTTLTLSGVAIGW